MDEVVKQLLAVKKLREAGCKGHFPQALAYRDTRPQLRPGVGKFFLIVSCFPPLCAAVRRRPPLSHCVPRAVSWFDNCRWRDLPVQGSM